MTDATLASTNGLRARNKLDKLRRIKEAAQSLFIAKGFDDTTMREIAERAGVGLGTIFLYAKDKRDLLFLTINEPLQHITQQAEGTVEPKALLIENLLAIAKLHYRFFGEQPALARAARRTSPPVGMPTTIRRSGSTRSSRRTAPSTSPSSRIPWEAQSRRSIRACR
jgi:AcrR family transcriptional regulator